MTFDPALATDRDKARSLLWDVDDAAPLREDITYDALLTSKGFAYCVAFLAQSFRSEYSRRVDSVSVAGVAVSWHARDAAWKDLAARYAFALYDDVASATAGVITIGRVKYASDPYDTGNAVGVPYG